LDYFRELRRSMGENPDPARKPEVLDREIQKLESAIQGSSGGRTR